MHPSRLLLRGLLIAIALPLLAISLHAAAIDLTIQSPNQIGFAGDSITFQGTITNNSGFDLDTTDFFLNFFGYDPVNVTLNQLLGETIFTIPNGTTSPVTDLFTFGLATTAGPGTYPSQVVLQDDIGDVSGTDTVTVTIPTPEPGTLELVAAGFLGGVPWIRRRRRAWPAVVLMTMFMAQAGMAQVSAVKLVTNPPGFGSSSTAVAIATPILNQGTVNATNVQVTGATLKGLSATTALPIGVGSIPAGKSAIAQASFNSTALVPNTPYLLTLRGTYQVGTATAGFTLNRFVEIPVVSPGSDTVNSGSLVSNTVSGAPYPPQPPDMGDEVNEPRPPIPTGPFHSGTPTPTGTGLGAFPSVSPGLPRAMPENTVVFGANSSVGIPGAGTNCNPGTPPASCAEPSGAEGGGVIFVTANWTAAYSTDGGSSFTQINPTKVFPNDAIGYCCDQVVQYVPSIDRFIWILQGNGYRMAEASPAQIISSGGKAWTYWNLGTGSIGQPNGTGFDYPDTSVGNNDFYITWDVGAFKNGCPTGCTSGKVVVRVPLTQIQAGGTIYYDYTYPPDSSLAWGSHLMQDTGDEIFWAGHNQNSALRVFSWAEGSNTYYWRDINIASWPNNTLSAPTPDGNDWFAFGFPGNAIIGATRSRNNLWFAWTAGTNNSFPQDHIEMVTLDRSKNFALTQQVQIWNSGFAFGYPALATNQCSGEIGLSLTIGGGGSYENHAVGFWGDFVVYTTTNSSSGANRWGDYMTIRQNGFTNMSAMGYGLSTVNQAMQSDVRYVIFGRNCG
jgi:hypothetical protein